MTDQQHRPLKVGLYFPPIEGRMDGNTPRWKDIKALIQRAEEIGFDSVWLPDHLVIGLEDGPLGIWETTSLLSALAASTSRVELGTTVICAGFRNPALLAKMADTIDEISGGRLILGLGAGYSGLEFPAFGYSTDHLFSRFEEAIQIIHGLLRDGNISFKGKYHEAADCVLRPRGPRADKIPIMIGGTGDKMLGLVSKYADMMNVTACLPWVIPPGRSHSEDLEEHLGRVDAACIENGRDPATLERTALVMWKSSEGLQDPWFGTRYGWPLAGEPEEIAEVFRGFGGHIQGLPDHRRRDD